MLETIKEVAAAEGLSVNAWVVKTLEQAANSPASTLIAKPETIPVLAPAILDIEPVLDTLLDKKLDALLATKFATIEERLGKLKA